MRADDAVRWIRHEKTLWRTTPGGAAVVLGATDGAPRSLTGSGAALWLLLDEPRTLEELSQKIAPQFGVEVDKVRAAIEPVIAELETATAIRRLQ